MFILLRDGVGLLRWSGQFVSKLPEVPTLYNSDTVIAVKDSKEGWAKALRQLIALYSGEIASGTLAKFARLAQSLRRSAVARLVLHLLVELFQFVIATFTKAQGRKLSSIECHDIMCKIGEVVVVGGVRRSAMISLSNLSDDRMRHAKSGNWWDTNPQRAPLLITLCRLPRNLTLSRLCVNGFHWWNQRVW